jgi:hypothetical protein
MMTLAAAEQEKQQQQQQAAAGSASAVAHSPLEISRGFAASVLGN